MSWTAPWPGSVPSSPAAPGSDDRGYADIPLTPPLTGQQIAEQFPTLGIRLGDPRPHVRGKIREYLPL